MPAPDFERLRNWTALPAPRFIGGNRVQLLQGGDELFPRMLEAIAAAEREIWLATYIFHDDPAAPAIADALKPSAARDVGARPPLARLARRSAGAGAQRRAGERSAGAGAPVAWRRPQGGRRPRGAGTRGLPGARQPAPASHDRAQLCAGDTPRAQPR